MIDIAKYVMLPRWRCISILVGIHTMIAGQVGDGKLTDGGGDGAGQG